MAPRNAHLTPRSAPFKVGDRAPDFKLLDQNRQEVSLSGLLKEGPVVLSFFPMAFTSTCTTEMECFNADKEKFLHKGARVVGISCDSFAVQKAFADAHKLDLPLLADMHREVCKGYGFYWADLHIASRGTVVVGKDGKVKWVQAREPKDAVKNAEVLKSV
jgi:peroxiredoxin